MAKLLYTQLKSPLTESAKKALLTNVHGTFLYLPDDTHILFKPGYLYKLGNRLVKCEKIMNGDALFHTYSIIHS